MIKILNFKNFNSFNKIRFYSSKINNNGSTAESTQSFLLNKQKANENLSFKKLDNNGVLPLSLSTIAIDADSYSLYDNEHKAILIKSIKNGCNVIKSTNESKLLQNVLSDLLDSNDIKRSELVFIKKTSPLKTSLPTPQPVQPVQPESSSSTSKSILLDQLSINSINKQLKKSLQDTQLDTIDIFLLDLNNIMKIINDGNSTTEEIYKLLNDEIFPHLEYLVLNGKIQSYGISSNDFSTPPTSSTSAILEIERLIEIKNQNKESFKHFLFIEYPFNVYQNHSIVNKIYNNNSNNLYEYLKENKITVLNNSPNSFNNQQDRFEMVPNHSEQDIQQQLKEAFNIAIHLETINPIFKDSVLQQQLLADKSLIGSLQWAHNLVYNSNSNKILNNLWLWKPVLSTKIKPTVTEAILSVFGNHVINTWGGNYRKAIDQLFAIYTKSLELQIYEKQSNMNTLFNSLTNNDQFKQFSNNSNHQKLTMLQKSTLLSSIGSDILFDSPSDLNNLKLLQNDIKIPNNNDQNNTQIILPTFNNLSKNINKYINDKK